MRLVVHLGEMLKVQMRVDLSRRNAGVPHQFLHGAQILRALQHVRCKRVAQAMGINVTGNALLQCAQLECAPHHWRTDAFATGTNKQGRQSHLGDQG